MTFWCRDLDPRFSVIFLPMIWIFMWCEEPEIKSKQVSKRDRTLICQYLSFWPVFTWRIVFYRFDKNKNFLMKNVCIKICTFGQLAEYGPERLVNGLHPISYRRAIPPTDWALCAGLHWLVCFRPNSPWTSVDVTQLNIPPNKKRIM